MRLPGPVEPWTRDEFVAPILGKTVLRLNEPHLAARAINAARHDGEWMIEAKVPVDALAVLGALGTLGFRVIDTNVQMDASAIALRTAVSSDLVSVREALPQDRAAVERVAADNLTTSRFHLDPLIGVEVGRRIKRAWVGNYFEGRRGEGLFVAEADGEVRGFLLVLERERTGIIDLIALDPSVRGTGAAGALIAAWLTGSTALERVLVGTQISNLASLRAYAKLKFRVCGASYVLHLHGSFPALRDDL